MNAQLEVPPPVPLPVEPPVAPVRRLEVLDLPEVATWTTDELEAALEAGETPDPDAIAPWEWNGYNVPFVTRLLGFRKFKKGFVPAGDYLRGYNVQVLPDGGPLDPWVVRRDRAGRAIHHGFFDVVTPTPPDDRYPHALLINYACGRNPRLDPSGALRDYIVSLGPDLMLGKAYAALGGRRVPISFFVLQRAEHLEASE